MTINELIANIDLDGTVADFDGALCSKMRAIQAPAEKSFELGDLAPEGDYPTYLEERMRLIKSQPGFWRNLVPLPLGLAVVEEMRQQGYTLNVLTKGPRKNFPAWSEKVEWAAQHMPDADVTITSRTKGLTYGRVLYDDWPPYIEQWLTWRPRGKVLMNDAAYNRNFSHPNVLRISSFDDLGKVTAVLVERARNA